MSTPSVVEITCQLRPQIRDLEGFLGAILLGSVSADMQDETSDYDLHLVFSDEAFERHPEYRDLLITAKGRKVDNWCTSLTELAQMDPRGDEAKEYVHAVYLYDHDGTVRRAVRSFVEIPHAGRHNYVAVRLDAYYNALFRSLKCRRHGYTLGYHAMSAESVRLYADVLYGMNGTIAPFINRVPFLLRRLPLLPAPAEVLSGMLENICKNADIRVQVALFDMTSLWMEQKGYRHVQDAWEGVLEAEIDRLR